ncbi:hypothetical protein SAMN05192588_0214 [Nonlabens sp. Hel1_33_55]|uniref:hypothetical protein n=1 Tax=Nonlabens sp. Hel1_33_55 TaxID=1336802 RepID=UPI000875A9EB|nr:hypothetical protein [Nonlabens sp. Hel1_33_55]SCX90907.1 hypothetical protein SAMN05192588_0214 [Nonlabens sp. Hel1_33_55]
MKTKILLLIVLAVLPVLTFAQVGIGTTFPSAGTLLHVDDGNGDKGILIPKVQIDDLSTQAPLTATPEVGTMVFNATGAHSVGFYYWDGSVWVAVNSGDDTNLATTNLTQDSETRTYDLNTEDLNFTNGSFGINKSNPTGTLDVIGNGNENSFNFVQSNNLTGEIDVFTIEDQDAGGGGQDHSSVLKVFKSGPINSGDDGFSLIELASTSSDPGANKYWISGRTVDEGAPFWGVDITDNDYWSTGGIQLGTTPNTNGTYTGGNFRVEANGNTGIGTVTPNARLQIDEDSSDFEHLMFQLNTSSGRPLNILQPDVTDINTPFTFQTNNAFNFRTDNTDALTILNTSQLALPSYVGSFQNETPTRILGLDAAGNVISSAPVIDSDADWFTSNTTTAPASIDDNIWTNGNVGIGTNNPSSSLHIVEATGNAGSAANGSITLEHGNAGGASSIVFRSRENINSDYGYIRFEDDGSGNGSSTENALLTIGIENDGDNGFNDDINLNPSGYVGVKNNAPKREIHIAGANSTMRIDGLNAANNGNVYTTADDDAFPVYVNTDGDLITQPSLVQSKMPLNLRDFTPGVTITSNNGSGVETNLNTSTITLTQPSLVQYSYQFSVGVNRSNGGVITDGAPRLFRAWFTVNGDNANHYGYDTGTYTNRASANGTYASGFYYLSGSGYVELPAGTHSFTLSALGFGADFDFRMRFGETTFDSIQAVIHR